MYIAYASYNIYCATLSNRGEGAYASAYKPYTSRITRRAGRIRANFNFSLLHEPNLPLLYFSYTYIYIFFFSISRACCNS